MSNLKQNGRLRWIPSYLRNRGQLTRAQKRVLRESWEEYGIRFKHGEVIDLEAEFERSGPVILEIGFGMGDHLVHLAQEKPDHRVLGIEVHRPGLAAAIGKAQDRQVTNVRVMRGDARLILSDYIVGRPFAVVIVQFPDPWPHPGDSHRRLIQEDFLALLEKRLVDGGELIIVTDVQGYAEHCNRVFSGKPKWNPIPGSPWLDSRIETGYELKAKEAGRSVSELVFRYTENRKNISA